MRVKHGQQVTQCYVTFLWKLSDFFSYSNALHACGYHSGATQVLEVSLVRIRSNISKTTVSNSPGVPNTEKQMKARSRKLSAFIVSSFWYSFLNELPTIIVCYFCFRVC